MKILTVVFALFINSLLLINICQSQWVQTYGINGGNPTKFASNTSTIFASTEYNGLFFSNDGGYNWKATSLRNNNIACVSASGNNIVVGSRDSGVYYSSNNGVNWVHSALNNKRIDAILIDGNKVLAGEWSQGIWISTNYGSSFTHSNLTNQIVRSFAKDGINYYAGTYNGLFRSTDNGLNWYYLFLSGAMVESVYITGNEIYGCTYDHGLYFSSNLGQTWNNIGLTYVYSAVKKDNYLVVATLGNGIFRSSNYGVNWEQSPINYQYIYSIAVFNNNIFAGTNGYGAFISYDNAGNWYEIPFSNARSRALTSKGNMILAEASSYIYKSTNQGAEWIKTNQITGSLTSNTNFFFSQLNKNIYRSSNDGNSWNIVYTVGPYSGVTTLAANYQYIFAGISSWPPNTQGMMRSTDNGSTWNWNMLNDVIYSLAFNGRFSYAGATKVFLSTNNGDTWSGTSSNYGTILSLASKYNFVLAGCSNNGGLFMSSDSGYTWNATSLVNKNVYALAIYDSSFIAGTDSGIYISHDLGVNWIRRNQGFNVIPNVQALQITNNYLLAGTYGNAIWRIPLSQVTDINNVMTETPSKYSLSQNYPNPFNPSTKLKFDVSKSDYVKIIIYDITGREVQTLVNERLQPGTYETTFDGSQLTSGMYFYRMITDGYNETKKMILLK